ncbi:unnamed protein product, partial [Rotaria sp. Silwood1]
MCSLPRKLTELDETYYKLIGPYAESLYRKKNGTFEHFWKGFSSFCYSSPQISVKTNRVEPVPEPLSVVVTCTQPSSLLQLDVRYGCQKPYGKQEMLRDIFLWSIYKGYIDIAFVLLLQIKSRISAALVAA